MHKYLLILTILLVSLGCSKDGTFEANNKAAFKACIETGGVPLQAWFNEKVLGDCIYKPVTNNEG